MATSMTAVIVTILSSLTASLYTDAIPFLDDRSISNSLAAFKSSENLLRNRNTVIQFDGNEDSVKHMRKRRQLNQIQSKIVDFVHPKPIVDTIREEDKYGNTVEHTFGKGVVKVVENLSNIINTVFAIPVNTVKKATKTATDVLNNIGGRLVGLQK